jgi:hypothetical protein
MGQVSIPWNSFNCGELSPLLEGRSDMPQYMKGGKTMLNMLPTVQGPATRRGGTRYIGNGLDSTFPSLLIRFSRSATESYVLAFSNNVLQFFFNGGKVGGIFTPYEVTTPYTQADLFNDDGTPAISAAESADVIYLAHPKYPPQVLSFFGPENWTLAPLNFVDGPWQDGNPNQQLQVYVNGGVTIGSAVTVTCTPPGIFTLDMVGSLMRIHQQDLTTTKPWQPGQMTPNIAVGVQRRSGFNTYQAVTVASGPAPPHGSSLLFVQTGGVTLTHTSGNAWDGDQTTTIDPIGGPGYFSTGVEWSYQDCGYGVVQITAFSDAQHVQAVVLRQLPTAVIGAGNTTYLWELGAWSNNQGWPAVVAFFRQRLTFAGGAGGLNRTWMSVVGDYANFADLYFGEVLEDSAVTVACQSTQVNNIVSLSGADMLFVGTTGGEFLIGPQSISDPFGPLNVQVSEQSQFGGRAVTPIRQQQYTLFIDKPGRRLRESSFQFTAGPSGSYVSNDKTVLSEHITEGGVIAMANARNPFYSIWMTLGNGNLISFIYCPEQDVHNWERHDVGASGKVISMCVVPNSTGEWDDVYLTVKRQTTYFGNVTTQYTIERIEQPFANLHGENQQDAFYVDAGLTLDNTIDAILTPESGYTNVGQANVGFSTNVPVFANTDVGRYIHYDWETTEIGDDGLTYPKAAKGVALITEFLTTSIVETTILAQWPPGLEFNPIPANGWRMTVTKILASSIPSCWYGQTLSFLADGGVQPDQVAPLTGGIDIDLQYPASIVQAGLKSPCQFTSMRPEKGNVAGGSIGKLSKLTRATIRLLNSLGLKLGTSIGDLEEIAPRPVSTPDDNPPPIYTGDTERQTFRGDWDRSGRFTVRQEQPLPLTIVAGGFLGEVSDDS